jgi:hypothetical protein
MLQNTQRAQIQGLLMNHLKTQGFYCAITVSGFTAIDEDGIMFTCSTARTVGTSIDTVGKIHVCKVRGQAPTVWFDKATAALTEFCKK